MQEVIKNIPTFKGRLNYIADVIKATTNNLSDDIYEAQQFKIIESCIEYLSLCSVETKDIISPIGHTVKTKDIISPVGHAIVEALDVQKDKIMAIKELRQHFGAGLKDAKEEVERVYDGTGFIVDRWEYEGKLLWVRK